jgi:hypothetical protein
MITQRAECKAFSLASVHQLVYTALIALPLSLGFNTAIVYADEELIIDDEEVIFIDDEIDFESGGNGDVLEVESSRSESSSLSESVEMYESQSTTFAQTSSEPVIALDQVQLEWGHFLNSQARDKNHAYAQVDLSVEWNFSKRWSVRLAVRADAYQGWRSDSVGDDDWALSQLDYGESYLRYTGDSQTLTLGAQQVIWGAIDEFPPTDKLSTQDLRRFVLDDLEQRRLASAAIRYQKFFKNSQLDIVVYPDFREAELPDKDSSWFPVNRLSGEVLGLDTHEQIEFLVRNTPLVDDPPESDGGFGLRYSALGDSVDYAFSVQKGRQSVPYFAYNPLTNSIESRYPRTSIVGADVSLEGLGGTLKFEFAWLSDTPITTRAGVYDTVESLQWGAALELFPGDGDARLNLQLTGHQLLNAPPVFERDQQLSINGSYETPFAEDQWRSDIRFNVGLDAKDIYLNPELAYIGWDGHEAYIEVHYFDGDKGTAGGFYRDNSVATFGWRANY